MHPLSAPSLREDGLGGAARPGEARGRLPRRRVLTAALGLLLAACGRKAQPEPPAGTPKDAFPKSYPPKGT